MDLSFTAVPGSAAAAPGARTCARHPDTLGPRFCSDCGAGLCTACHRDPPHRRCPACAAKAGQPTLKADFSWFVYLFLDGLVHAWPPVLRRVVPLASGLMLASTVLLFGLAMPELTSGREEDTFGAIAIAAAAFTACGLLAMWMQPGLDLPLLTRPPFGRRLWRAMVGGLLPFGVFAAVIAGSTAGSALAFQVSDVLGAVATVLLGFGGTGVALLVVLPAVLPAQAAAALRGASTREAARLPLRGGFVGYLQLSLLHCGLMTFTYGVVYTLIFPAFMLVALSPWVAAVGVLVASILALCGTLYLQAAYATASMRYLEDRARS